MKQTLWLCTILLAAWSLAAPPLSAQGEYIWKDGRWVPAPKAEEGTAAGEIELIRKHLEDDSPRTALRAVDRFLDRYPESPLREEAYMLAGRAEMMRGRYYQAYEQFEKQLSEFPSGEHFDRALQREYEIAKAFLEGKKRLVWGFLPMPARGDGQKILLQIAEYDPGSAIAEKALLTLADDYYENREYDDAVTYYDQYLQLYRNAGGEQVAYASLMGAKARYASWRGLKYDETQLIDAEQRFKRFQQNFPREAARQNIAATLAEIAALRVKLIFQTAQFYERVDRKAAAVYYYRIIVTEHEASSFAAQAAQRIEAIGPLPEPEPARPPTGAPQPPPEDAE